jgi:hypothetical protein
VVAVLTTERQDGDPKVRSAIVVGPASAGDRVPGGEATVIYSSAMHTTGTIIIS